MSAEDGFERYYEEKLWALLPELHRMPDADGTPPDAMRRAVRLIALSAARMRRDIDRVWEDQSIESCDDAAIERFAELVGTRPAAGLDARAQRVDVATTLHARRRRGTPLVLEATARSLGGWDVALVEAFRTLARSFHGLDERPERTRGRWSGTPRGGLADLRSGLGASLASSPFSDLAHTPDVRLPRGRDGWHAIRTLCLHLFAWRVLEIEGADPAPLGDAGEPAYTFDPSGRDVPLFAPGASTLRPARQVRRRGDPPEAIDTWVPVAPWEVRAPIACRVLGHAEHELSDEHVQFLASLGAGSAPSPSELSALRTIVGVRFPSPSRLAERLADLGVSAPGSATEPPWYRRMLALSLRLDTGKAALWPDAIEVALRGASGTEPIERERVSAGDLSERARHPAPRDTGIALIVDPALGRFAWSAPRVPTEPITTRYHVGVASDIGALPVPRAELAPDPAPRTGGGVISAPLSGTLTIADSRSYVLRIEPVSRGDLRLQAASGERPFVRLAPDDTSVGARVVSDAGAPRTLVIEGLWCSGLDERIAELSLEGTWDRVVIRGATLDPGGVRADGAAIGAVPLTIRGVVGSLHVERSILAAIRVDVAAGGALGALWMRDSIVDAQRSAAGAALALGDAEADLARATVLGDLVTRRLEASDCVVLGEVRVIDTSHGCWRFSAAHGSSRLPRRFEPWPEAPSSPERVAPWFFRSLRFGDPDYVRVATLAPEPLRSGAETGGERGAHARLGEAALLRGVAAKVDELAPVGVRSALLLAER